MSELQQVIDDLHDAHLPRDLDAIDKLKADCLIGERLSWYYQDEASDDQEHDIDPRANARWSGLAIPAQGVSVNGELEITECIVVIDRYPAEKTYCECDWVAMGRLLNQEDLVEVFSSEAMR